MILNKKSIYLPLLLLTALVLQQCKTPQPVVEKPVDPNRVVVSYAAHISPIMERSCTPCHFPAQGKVTMLDNFDAAKKHIHTIIHRVEMPVDDIKFMPFKNKKEPLTKAEINLLKEWLAQEMPE
jgi:hypothetical protein